MTKPVEKTIHMTKRQWEKWNKALRSGKIKQGYGNLIDKDSNMCCLGVLEYALEGKVEHTIGLPSRNFCRRNNIKFFDEYLEETTSGHYHYDFQNSPYLTGGYAHELNDDRNLSFKQIAERIKHRVKFIPEKKKVTKKK